eukprot:TRINITY_DN28271_c0_g1_i1.p1 TRINITY_DN28271_c0_g1~~TRINITY_DN28271_c0_g1_i1.p1  ORF type:complete len:177 (+),score=6.91 TRINITY_DN28271_c0_g1_i1:3-533(+)
MILLLIVFLSSFAASEPTDCPPNTTSCGLYGKCCTSSEDCMTGWSISICCPKNLKVCSAFGFATCYDPSTTTCCAPTGINSYYGLCPLNNTCCYRWDHGTVNPLCVAPGYSCCMTGYGDNSYNYVCDPGMACCFRSDGLTCSSPCIDPKTTCCLSNNCTIIPKGDPGCEYQKTPLS